MEFSKGTTEGRLGAASRTQAGSGVANTAGVHSAIALPQSTAVAVMGLLRRHRVVALRPPASSSAKKQSLSAPITV